MWCGPGHWEYPWAASQEQGGGPTKTAIETGESSLLRSGSGSFAVSASTVSVRLRTRIVWTAHNLVHHEAKQSRIDHTFTSLIARHADAIIVHGETAKSRLLAQFTKVRAAKVTVIPHGHYIDCYPNIVDQARARRFS